jgi:hypothetical protein
VQRIFGVEYERSWWALWKRPEGSSFLGLGVKRIDMQKLLDVVIEVLLELVTSMFNTVFEGLWPLL